MQFVPTLPAEEVARANFYGLLARLFYAPPDATLLATLAAAQDLEAEAEDGGISGAWRALAEASGKADPESVREEYDAAFIGVGKAPVTLYTSAYSIRFTNEVPLVALRAELERLGIARRAGSSEPEDHIATLCEVMRFLIAEQKSDLEHQKEFFERWIWPTVQPLCSAIQKSEEIVFYKTVSDFLLRLCTLEHTAFEML
ncbi:MAG TPA: molecular chaperone TorD family protein [Burkholderiales bacterium]|jgi:TorA maturation chaperone TorD